MPAGSRITLIHSPVVDHKTGRVVKQFTKYLSGGNANMTDVYIVGDRPGTQAYTPHFTYRKAHAFARMTATLLTRKAPPDGLRFVEVRGLPNATAKNLVCHMTHTNLAEQARFSSDNDVLNGTMRNLKSAATVLQSIPMDVPDRERLPWTGDAGDTRCVGTASVSAALTRILRMECR